jgi:hypothetical protein
MVVKTHPSLQSFIDVDRRGVFLFALLLHFFTICSIIVTRKGDKAPF